MSGPFDKELESIANAHTQDFARKLAHEVANLILRRLGIDQSAVANARPAAAAPAAAAPAAAKKKAAPAAKPSAPAAPAPAAKAAAAPVKKPAAPQPKRAASGGGEDRASVVDKVFRVVSSREGVAVGDVVKATNLERGPVTAALKALKEEGRIFMGGDRRFARYAMNLAAAEKASEAARKG